MAAGDVSNSPNQPFSVLSPNRLLTGRNHHRFAHYQVTVDPRLPSQLLARNDQIVSSFMKIYARSIMLLNTRPSKWPLNSSSDSPPRPGDIVYTIKSDDNAHTIWSLARVLNVQEDGRKLELQVPRANGGFSTLIRCPRDCAPIVKEDSPNMISLDFFKSVHDGRKK